MNQADEDCTPNKFGSYGFTFINDAGLTKHQIKEKFNVYDDDEPIVFCVVNTSRVFVNYKIQEHAISGRKLFPELKATFPKNKQSVFARKEDYNAKHDSDNRSCSSIATTIACASETWQNSQNSKPSKAKSKMLQSKISAASGNGEYNSKQNKGQSKALTKNDSVTGASGRYTAEQKYSSGSGKTEPETKESKSSTKNNSNVSLKHNDDEDDLDEIPLLVNTYDVVPVEGLRTVETTAVVLSSIPTWFVEGEVYRLVHESTSLWPLFIDTFYEEDEIALLSAYVHFRHRKEAEECVKKMNYMWVENRQLICLLLDEIPLSDE